MYIKWKITTTKQVLKSLELADVTFSLYPLFIMSLLIKYTV